MKIARRLRWWYQRKRQPKLPTVRKIKCAGCKHPVDPFTLSDGLCVRCRANLALALSEHENCRRCNILIDGYSVSKIGGVCPRCGYDIDGIIDMETEDLVDPEKLKEWQGMNEFNDLMKMLINWSDGYTGIINEFNVDWSMPHEYLQEFAENMIPYIAKLRDRGYATPERMKAIGDTVLYALELIINKLQCEEGALKLQDKWSEEDQEIKDYWIEKTPRLAYILCGTKHSAFEAIEEEGSESSSN